MRHNEFALVMIVLIALAAALFLYSENPFLFSSAGPSGATGGTVSVYVLPNDENGSGQPAQNSGDGGAGT